MGNFIKIYDTVDIKPLEPISDKNKDNFFANQQNGKPLIVKIAASHSGLITRNNGFYLPDKMRKGSSTFTAQYNKPIQVHHNDDQDPVGRIIKAEYVDINAGISILNKAKDSFSTSQWSDFTTGKMGFVNSINFIVDILNRKDSVLDDPDYQGAGFAKITAAITDPDAIQKVLDGRYLTGSVGLTTDAAVCSVCKQDWVQTDFDERCAHRPGKMYDGKKAFVITGNLHYEEYSFVNTPADRHSRVIEYNINGVIDSFKTEDSVGRTIAVNLITDSINQEEQSDMKAVIEKLITDMKTKFAILGDEFFTQLTASLDNKEDAFVKAWSEMDETTLPIEFENYLDGKAIEKIFTIEDKVNQIAAVKVVRVFLENEVIEELIKQSFENVVKFQEALNEAEWNSYSEAEDETLIAYKTEHPEDSKLSTAQRKRLPGSSFCGPNKSFPVPDCAHVTAARRLIGRASVSAATKTRILSCVSRKASAMGCDKKDNKEDKKQEDKKTIDELNAKILALNSQVEILTKDLTVGNQSLVTLTKEFTDRGKELQDTRDEMKLIHDDLIEMTDQSLSTQAELTETLGDKLLLLRKLSGEVIEDETKIKETIGALSNDQLKNSLKDLAGKVDIKKITDSINSGLSKQTVNGNITDPTLNTETEKKYDANRIKEIGQEYIRIQFGGDSIYGRGPQAAESFKQDMQARGFLPTQGGK